MTNTTSIICANCDLPRGREITDTCQHCGCSPEAGELAHRIKAEVLELIAAGTIPATVASFSELHDFVDANCLGGTEGMYDEKTEALLRERGLLVSDDEIGTAVLEEMNGLMNPAFDAVDAWLKAGRP